MKMVGKNIDSNVYWIANSFGEKKERKEKEERKREKKSAWTTYGREIRLNKERIIINGEYDKFRFAE